VIEYQIADDGDDMYNSIYAKSRPDNSTSQGNLFKETKAAEARRK